MKKIIERRVSSRHFFVFSAVMITLLGAACDGVKDTPQRVVLQLNPGMIAAENGLAFSYPVPELAGESDVSGAESRSPYGLTEDGKLLSPAHSLHDEIRKNGQGRWSHWGGNIYFSSSDGSDPRQSGRKYALVK